MFRNILDAAGFKIVHPEREVRESRAEETMKSRIVSVLGACALAACLAWTAAAQQSGNTTPSPTTTQSTTQTTPPAKNPNATPVINERQKNQKARIKEGVKSGELTKHEAKKLRKEEKEIREEKKAAKADGTVTKEERKEIRKDERKASRDIAKQKHDAQKRPKARKKP
jgi:hypothetical protein